MARGPVGGWAGQGHSSSTAHVLHVVRVHHDEEEDVGQDDGDEEGDENFEEQRQAEGPPEERAADQPAEEESDQRSIAAGTYRKPDAGGGRLGRRQHRAPRQSDAGRQRQAQLVQFVDGGAPPVAHQPRPQVEQLDAVGRRGRVPRRRTPPDEAGRRRAQRRRAAVERQHDQRRPPAAVRFHHNRFLLGFTVFFSISERLARRASPSSDGDRTPTGRRTAVAQQFPASGRRRGKSVRQLPESFNE